MKYAIELMNDRDLEMVSGGTTIQTISLLTKLQEIGVPGIPDGLTLKSDRDVILKGFEAKKCLKGIFEKYGLEGVLFVNPLMKNKYKLDGKKIGAIAVVEHIKKQLDNA